VYFYKKHLFFCVNERDSRKVSCHASGAEPLYEYAKEQVSKQGLKGKGAVRVSCSGCLGRCKEGPILVVYPDAVWYQYHNEQDIDEIIQKHLIEGEVVERLQLQDKKSEA